MYEQLNSVDYGYGHPGGDLSAGIAGEVVSEKSGQQRTEVRGQGQKLSADHCSLSKQPSTEFNPC